LLDELVGGDAHLCGNGVGEAVPPAFHVVVGFFVIREVHAGEHIGRGNLVVQDDGIWVGKGSLGQSGDAGCHGGGE
jgi:hypothetical protein